MSDQIGAAIGFLESRGMTKAARAILNICIEVDRLKAAAALLDWADAHIESFEWRTGDDDLECVEMNVEEVDPHPFRDAVERTAE